MGTSFHVAAGEAPADESELRESVELAVSRAAGRAAAVSAVRRRPFAGTTSYPVEIVTVELSDGGAVEIFLKDFGRSRLPKDAASTRRERELRVYGTLLDGAGLGTARFYGARWDERRGRYWLMLEFVDGRLLRDCGFEYWVEAAAWLGRLHARFRPLERRLASCEFLLRHDADHFRDTAERARAAVSGASPALARRLAPVLTRYRAIVPSLSREAGMLVHGSYRPQNILVAESSGGVRLCPTDWELAALGGSTYDLAFLCDGFRPPQLDALLDAYERAAKERGGVVPDRAALRRELDCFRLHKLVNSLCHVPNWPRPIETASKVVTAAEELAGAVE